MKLWFIHPIECREADKRNKEALVLKVEKSPGLTE